MTGLLLLKTAIDALVAVGAGATHHLALALMFLGFAVADLGALLLAVK